MGCGSSVSRLPDSASIKNAAAAPSATQQPQRPPSPEAAKAGCLQQSDASETAASSRPVSAAVKSSPPPPASRPASAAASAPTAAAPLAATAPSGDDDPQADTRRRAEELTRILGKMKSEQEGRGKKAAGDGGDGGEGGSNGGGALGFGAEVEALMGGLDTFPDLLKELLAAPTQVLLPSAANPEDAAALQAVSGCTADQATRLLDCLAVILAAAEALGPDGDDAAAAASAAPAPVASTADAAGAAGEEQPAAAAKKDAPAAAAAATGAEGGAPPGAVPTPQQLTRLLGTLSGLVSDYPGLRTAAMARGAPGALLRILLRHTERSAAANAALVLSALAAGPPPHKTTLIVAGAVQALLRAVRGDTAAAAAAGGDAPVVAANACSALANLVTNHTAGAAAVAAGGGVKTLLGLVDVGTAANVRANAAGVLVQLTALHESYRAAIVAAGGVPALAAGMLRGPDAPACNAATALYNLAALTPPNLRIAMAHVDSPLAIVPTLLLCMAGRNATGAADESVAASASTRVNASAVLLELCKDPAAAPLLTTDRLAVPAALAALAAGRLPPPPPQAPPPDILAGGVELLYPVPPVVRGNALMGLMALARMGPGVQMELGRCGALGTLLELIAPGEDTSMQVNSANAICSLAAANGDILEALVAARCVPLMAALLLRGGEAARANVCAVFVTMMHHEMARTQLQECGGLAALVRMTAAVLDARAAEAADAEAAGGVQGAAGVDTGGLLCNAAGSLAEAAKYPELRRALMQVEFGESLSTLLRCLTEKGAPEPVQVNAAAALCHLCREQPAAVQLGRMRGVEVLKAVIAADGPGGAESEGTGAPSPRLVHNASRALKRLRCQIAEAEAAAVRAATAALPGARSSLGLRPSSAAVGSATGDSRPASTTGSAAGGSGGPRAVWDAAVERPGGSAEGNGQRLEDDDEMDDVSTVVRPPLPLAAF